MKKENQKKVTEDKKNSKKDMYILHYEKTVDFTEQYKKIFQERFCKLLEEFIRQGHQQKEITEKTGISPASITQYKNGTNTPKGYTLESLANFFNVSSNYLLGKSDTPTYTFEDINDKTGLSQKAIEELYKFQHNYSVFDSNTSNVDITEKRKISNTYRKKLEILSAIIENSVDLFGVLDAIEKYEIEKDKMLKEKDTEKQLDMKEETEILEYKMQKRFLNLVNNIVQQRGGK